MYLFEEYFVSWFLLPCLFLRRLWELWVALEGMFLISCHSGHSGFWLECISWHEEMTFRDRDELEKGVLGGSPGWRSGSTRSPCLVTWEWGKRGQSWQCATELGMRQGLGLEDRKESEDLKIVYLCPWPTCFSRWYGCLGFYFMTPLSFLYALVSSYIFLFINQISHFHLAL